MLAVYKLQSQESGPWNTSTGSNRIRFVDYMSQNELTHLDKSYIILNVSVDEITMTKYLPGGTADVGPNWVNPKYVWFLGDNHSDWGLGLRNGPSSAVVKSNTLQPLRNDWTNDLLYNSSSLIQNTRVDSFTNGNLETNRDINFYNETLKYYTSNFELNKQKTLKGYGWDQNITINIDRTANTLDYETHPMQTIFTDVVQLNTPAEVAPNIKETTNKWLNKGVDILVPVSDVFMLGKSKIPGRLGNMTYQIELEQRTGLVGQHNKIPGCLTPELAGRDCVNIGAGAPPENDEFTLTAVNNGYLSPGDTFILYFTYDINGGAANQEDLIYGVVQAVGAPDNRLITSVAPLFGVDQYNIRNIIVKKMNGLVLEENRLVGNVISADDAVANRLAFQAPAGGWTPDNIPFFQGQELIIQYIATVTGNLTVRLIRKTVLKISIENVISPEDSSQDPFTRILYVTLVDDGANAGGTNTFLQSAGHVYIWSPIVSVKPTLVINSASLVVWKQVLKDGDPLLTTPIEYTKLMLEPFNRLRNINFEKTFNLPPNVFRFLLMNRLTTLVSNDRNLANWRFYEDSQQTTDRDLFYRSSLDLDVVIKTLKEELKNLEDRPTIGEGYESSQYNGVSLLMDRNRTTNSAPLLQVIQNAVNAYRVENVDDVDQGQLEQSLVYLYSHVLSVV